MAGDLAGDAARRMDVHYRLQRHVYDVSRRYFLLGRTTMIRGLDAKGCRVLEIGCGTAWNLVQIANQYPSATCFGVDVSEAMLDTARRSLLRRDLQDRIALRQGDAVAFDPVQLFGHSQFDRVVASYTLSMIPRWQDVLSHASRLIAPGGSMHIVDFGQCGRLPPVVKGSLHHFLKRHDVIPRRDLLDCVTRISAEAGLDVTFATLFRGYAELAILARR